mgnify:CR=1 FL=1
MMDLNATLAPDMYLVIRDLRDLEAKKLEWNRRYHELADADRAAIRVDLGASAASLAGSPKA